MKKYGSIWMLYARSTLRYLLALLVLGAAAEGAVFYLQMDPEWPLESILDQSHLALVCGVVFLLWCAVLVVPSFSKALYTVNRLRITPREIFCCHALYNAVSLLILWGFQTAFLLALFRWYGTQASEHVFSSQSIMLAFYRVPLLHGLLPLEDWPVYLRNLLYILSLGAAAAYPNLRPGRRTSAVLPAAVLPLMVFFFFPTSVSGRAMDLLGPVIGVITAVTLLRSGHDMAAIADQDEREAQAAQTDWTAGGLSDEAP